MSRKSWTLGALVFALTLLLNMPAAFVSRFVAWAPGWQPQGVAGTVWHGRAEQLGSVGPVSWRLRPWMGQSLVSVGFQQQAWELKVQGWPWAWRAELLPAGSLVTPATAYVVDGRWQGRLLMQGRGAQCTSGEGSLQGRDLAVLSPWMVVLGNAHVALECRDGLKLLADVRREGEHRFEIGLEPVNRRMKLSGQVEPTAMVAPLLVQAGLLKAGSSQFETVLGKR
ncbi:type II secretion system protein N [Pseudomonas capsici]|uniref:type II secretion system protein N n=1 Tax=Pseudomonas capsici TaxID=2810614 RepID=UPI0021F1E3A5|nr:type II secretion system protein N [Pseudomonas capsici]MCV4281430.1 type II secretion system protein N [Pseudomonas capsici]